MNVSDVWEAPASANPTHSFAGAGVTTWGSATIENDTSVRLLVSNAPGSPPQDASDAWRIVPAGGLVTVPLGTPGVAYRLEGTPAAGGVVQTILDTEAAPAGGSTGTVNVASGQVTLGVGSTVNVQTAAGITLSTATGLAAIHTIGINAGTTIDTVSLKDAVQRLVLLYSGSGATIYVTVSGAITGAVYWAGWMPRGEVIAISVTGRDTAHGTSVDSDVDVEIISGPGGGQLTVVQSYAPPALAANDLFPTSEGGAAATMAGNVWVHEAGAKLWAQASPAVVGPTTIIPAPGVGRRLQLHRAIVTPDLAGAGYFQMNSGAIPLVVLVGDANVVAPMAIDFAGLPLPENTALTVTLSGAKQWRVSVFYSLLII